jgi:hypothetical protein
MTTAATKLEDVCGLSAFQAGPSELRVRVNPLVIAACIDAFARREERETRAIGTLMGYVSEGSVLDIADCYTVRHNDKHDTVSLDTDYHKKMVKQRTEVHPKEQVIGWFSCGKDIGFDAKTANLQKWYRSRESQFSSSPGLQQPCFLHVNPEAEPGKLGVHVYTSQQMPGTEYLMRFDELPLCKSTFQQEKNIMDMVMEARTTGTSKPINTLDAFSRNLDELMELFKKAKAYVQGVLSGQTEANPEVGRALSRALQSESLVDEGKFNDLCNGAMKDTLMVMYLSNLARTQIVLVEQIGRILQRANEQQ